MAMATPVSSHATFSGRRSDLTTTSNSSTKKSVFFLLPPELRLIVYTNIVAGLDIDLKRTDAGCRTFEPALLRSDTAIRHEAMQVYYYQLESLVDEAEAERYAATVRLLAVLNKRLEFVVPWELQYALSEDDAAIKHYDKLATIVDLERDKMEAEGFPVAQWRARRRKSIAAVSATSPKESVRVS